MVQNMVFKRYELKYLMSEEQKESVYSALKDHMVLDRYGRSSIRNIYFDTDDFQIVRRSIERPVYKEKIRVRSYGRPHSDGEVFVELKKKYKSVVYKRRLTMPLDEAMGWLTTEHGDYPHSQIGEEIDFTKNRYRGIRPAMLLSYEREAYYDKSGSDLRITIDSDIMARMEDVNLDSELGGHRVLPEGYTLMEIKTMYGYPEWLLDILNSVHLYKSSFSKYGNAYKEMVLCRMPEGFLKIPTGPATVENHSRLLQDTVA